MFLSEDAFTENSGAQYQTFPTTVLTRTRNTATLIDPAVLATSNGHNGKGRKKLGSTSQGSVRSAASGVKDILPGSFVMPALAMILGGTLPW